MYEVHIYAKEKRDIAAIPKIKMRSPMKNSIKNIIHAGIITNAKIARVIETCIFCDPNLTSSTTLQIIAIILKKGIQPNIKYGVLEYAKT